MENIQGLSQNPQQPVDDDKIEAATMLQGFKEMLAADPEKVIHKTEDGQEFTEQDYIASILADRVNNTPFYQEKFNLGGKTGRKVIGFQPLVSPEMIEYFGEEKLQGLPRSAYVPIISNEKTGTTGPMTKRASTDLDDEVEYVDLENLERIVSG